MTQAIQATNTMQSSSTLTEFEITADQRPMTAEILALTA